MINSTAFDYVNVLTKAADASYQREAINEFDIQEKKQSNIFQSK